jgi:chromosome segregation ATPase
VLGRQKSASEFIRFGSETGVTEIELKGRAGEPNVVVRREYRREDNRSEVRLNGRPSTLKEVAQRVRQLNVQVDNLCQFMPQERVYQLAGLPPAGLLREAERALGGPELLQRHEELQARREKLLQDRNSLAAIRDRIEKLRTKNRALENDRLRYQEYQRHMERIELLRKKRPWLQFEEVRQCAIRAKEASHAAQERLREARSRNEPLQRRLGELHARKDALQEELRGADRALQEADKSRQAAAEEFERLDERHAAHLARIASLRRQADERRRELEDARRALAEAERELAQLPAAEQGEARLRELARETDELRQLKATSERSVRELERPLEEARRAVAEKEAELRALEDVSRVKRERLMREHDKVYRVLEAVERARRRFREAPIGPLALHVSARSPAYADMLDAVAAKQIFNFIVRSREDEDVFFDEAKRKARLNFNLLRMLPEDEEEHLHGPRTRIEELASRGEYRGRLEPFWLLSQVDAPRPVLAALAQFAHMDRIAVARGDWTVDQAREFLAANREIYALALADRTMRILPSRDGDIKVLVDEYPSKKNRATPRGGGSGAQAAAAAAAGGRGSWFGQADQERRRQEMMRELEERRKHVQEIAQKLERMRREAGEHQQHLEKLGEESKRLKAAAAQRQMLQARVTRRRQAVVELEQDQERDISREIEREEREAKRLALERYAAFGRLLARMQEIAALQAKRDEAALARSRVEAPLARLLQENEQLAAELAAAERDARQHKEEYERLRREAQRLMQEAEAGAPLAEYKERFEALPDSLEELEQALQDAEVRAQANQVSPAVIEAYEQRQRQIEQYEARIRADEEALRASEAELQRLKAEWIGPVRQHVAALNARFSQLFREMGCQGEVRLAEDPEDDFSRYQLDILVRFREEGGLRLLNAQTQSGGERSVSTMLFLLAMQELTPAPFRLVDEINQGMDPRNERMVFSQIVKAACRPGLPQYFLITPKLLPDLEYRREMLILSVHNGPCMLPQRAFSAAIARALPAFASAQPAAPVSASGEPIPGSTLASTPAKRRGGTEPTNSTHARPVKSQRDG